MKKWRLGWVAVCVAATTALNAMGGLIISQYYEGRSNDRWIEIYNPGPSAVDMATEGYRLGLWSNVPTNEYWKTGSAPTYPADVLTNTIPAGGTFLFSHTNAVDPKYAVRDQGGQAAWFTGNDSIVLFKGDPYAFSNVVDAIGVTTNNYTDRSYVRTNTVTTGVSTDFNDAEWIRYTTNAVCGAAESTNERLGYHSTGAAVFSVSFNKTTGFTVEEGTSDSITATAANGTTPYAYSWSSTLGGAYYTTNDNVFTILATAPTGTYSATVVATDDEAQSVTNSLNFSVLPPAPKYPITVNPSLNGTTTTTPTDEAEAGQTVTINATPDSGYAVDTKTVLASDSSQVTVNGSTFTMPAQGVTVTVTYVEFSGSTLFISEVADPSGTGGGEGRFVELYNAGASAVDLAAGQWYLARQANGSTWANIALTGTVNAASTYVIAYSATSFPALYPAAPAPNQVNGNVNGTGDDGYFLYSGGNQSAGTLQDAYGVIDQDGSTMPWEYTDSRAVRNAGVSAGNPTWTASEWTIPASAVYADMTPGVHPDGGAVLMITFNKTTGFTVGQGSSDTLVATAANGTAPYTYGWSSTLGGAYYTADTNVFTILATAPTGSYTATATVTDSVSAGATNTIAFSVVAAHAITITPPVNGTVTTTPTNQAFPGATVTINATPAGGYAVETITVTGADMSNIPVTGTTFTMPAQAVTVAVTFMVYDAPESQITFETATLPTSYTNNTATLEDGKVWSTMRTVRGNLENDKKIGTYSARLYPVTGTNAVLQQTEAYAEPISKMSFSVASYGTDNMANVLLLVQASANGTDWETVLSLSNATDITATLTEHVVETMPANAVYVRFMASAEAASSKRLNIDNVGFWFGEPSPYLSHTGATTITLGEAFSLLFTLHNATASGWEYTLESASREELDNGSTNTFNWTPSHTGTYYLVMTALNEAVNPIASNEVTLTVNPVDTNAPAVQITGDLTGTAGVQMNLSITLVNGTAADWQIVLKDPTNADAGYNFDAPPAFSFTPSLAGTYVLTATAVDGSENPIASKIQNLTVDPISSNPPISTITLALNGTGNFYFSVPSGYTLMRVEGADPALDANGQYVWTTLISGTGNDYTVSGSTVTILSGATDARMIRMVLTPQ